MEGVEQTGTPVEVDLGELTRKQLLRSIYHRIERAERTILKALKEHDTKMTVDTTRLETALTAIGLDVEDVKALANANTQLAQVITDLRAGETLTQAKIDELAGISEGLDSALDNATGVTPPVEP